MAPKESIYVRVAERAYEVARETLPPYRHPKSPHRFTQPQLAACVVLAFYLDLSYRDAEQWLLATDQVRQALGLTAVPSYSTLCRAYGRLKPATWQKLLKAVLAHVAPVEDVLAGDSTGFRPTNASAYYVSRRGRTLHDYIKGAYAVGAHSQLILAAYGQRVAGQRAWVFLADAGFDGKHVETSDLIPPMRRNGKVLAPARKARADLVSQARLDGLYGQRWMCETVHSVIKRKCGDTIRSRDPERQKCESLVKAVVYDLHRIRLSPSRRCLQQCRFIR